MVTKLVNVQKDNLPDVIKIPTKYLFFVSILHNIQAISRHQT